MKTPISLRRATISLFGTLLLLLVIPKAIAGLIEYALINALIAILVIVALDVLPPGAQTVITQLNVSVEGAKAANATGDRVTEASRLSKAIGAAQALIGMTTSCGNCAEVRETLQEIIGQATLLRAATGAGPASCRANGIIQPFEQCDPLAIPTGCPANTTAVIYCSDECRCEVAPIP